MQEPPHVLVVPDKVTIFTPHRPTRREPLRLDAFEALCEDYHVRVLRWTEWHIAALVLKARPSLCGTRAA